MTNRERLAAWVSKIDFPDDPYACWPWTKSLNSSGYGSFRTGQGVRGAHTFGYRIFVGPIPDGMQLDHTCCDPDECSGGPACPHRKCVNPMHLEPVPSAENTRRGNVRNRAGIRNKEKTRCPQGHSYAEGNTFTRKGPNGMFRVCRTCKNASNRRSAARKRGTTA